jgi:hypothetical protein
MITRQNRDRTHEERTRTGIWPVPRPPVARPREHGGEMPITGVIGIIFTLIFGVVWFMSGNRAALCQSTAGQTAQDSSKTTADQCASVISAHHIATLGTPAGIFVIGIAFLIAAYRS